jgi:hypothetical protein
MNEAQSSGHMGITELRELTQRQGNILVASGTGKALIDDVDPEYKRIDAVVRAQFRQLGLKSPFPWYSVGEWHGFYSQGDMPTYASRRLHIGRLISGAFEQLDDIEGLSQIHDPKSNDDPTWDAINGRLANLIQEYSTAKDKDTWQDAGRRAREILIDLGKLIADPSRVPQGADARAWFDLLLDTRASGGEHSELRGLMRKTWDLAQKVTHGDISDVDAFAAAQATVLLVRTTQKLLGL